MRFLKGYWQLAAAGFVSLLIGTAAMLVIPRISQVIIDQGIAQQDEGRVLWLSLAMIGLALVRALFQFLQGVMAARTAQGIRVITRGLPCPE